jgi:thiosulfate/3-mercaptopyruvate sulfurtransferase
MTLLPGPLVSTDWLARHIGQPGLVVLDASRHLPAAKRDPIAEFETGHIPGARFFDLAVLVDRESDVPQALPRPEQLANCLASLGVSSDNAVVIYDDSAVKTSARAWYLLTAHGLTNVAILDGGLRKWRAEGRELEPGASKHHAIEPSPLQAPTSVRMKADLLANLDTKTEQVVDARGADRVFGSGIDPVHGGENGRIPGSFNLPFNQLFAEDGTYLPTAELAARFEQAGVDADQPIVTTCGSGVTACVLLFALHLMGKDKIALYDGSWVDWSSDPSTPKAAGPE